MDDVDRRGGGESLGVRCSGGLCGPPVSPPTGDSKASLALWEVYYSTYRDYLRLSVGDFRVDGVAECREGCFVHLACSGGACLVRRGIAYGPDAFVQSEGVCEGDEAGPLHSLSAGLSTSVLAEPGLRLGQGSLFLGEGACLRRGSSGDVQGRVDGQFCHDEVGTSDGRVVADGGCNGGTGLASNAAGCGVSTVGRGRFWERNFRKKRARKERKMAADSWRSDASPDNVGSQESRGFWGSCSPGVRQELIESKARMHVAENQRREAEAKAKVEYLASPEALIRKAVDLQLFAEKKVSGVADNKVSGWAKTVVSASVESLAKTAPSTVPSFDDVVKELDSISVAEAERVRAAREQEVKEMQERYQSELSAVLARVADLELEKSSSEASSATRVEELEKQLAGFKAERAIDYKTKFFKASHDKHVLEERLARYI